MAKACRLEGLALSMLSSELPFMTVVMLSAVFSRISSCRLCLATRKAESANSDALANGLVFPKRSSNVVLNGYFKMVVSLCDCFCLIADFMPLVCSLHRSPWSPSFSLSLLFYCVQSCLSHSLLSCPLWTRTKHNDRNTHLCRSKEPSVSNSITQLKKKSRTEKNSKFKRKKARDDREGGL